tara:strand:- start:217 stop:783 length:567 start_codon:yes stop_codon:yes gene_type:complete
MKIKQQIFVNLFNKFDDKPFTLKDIREQVWIAQGKMINKFISKQGYYNVNIGEWVTDGLLEKPFKNTYLLTSRGIKYGRVPNEVNKEIRDNKKERQNSISWGGDSVSQGHRENFTHLIGRKIENVRHLTPRECAEFGWNKSPLAIWLDDKTCLIPQTDDEGNDGGAMMHIDIHQDRDDYIKEEVLYTI